MDTNENGTPACACAEEFGHQCRNVGREHFATCETCGVYWHVGSNIFSSWQHELSELGEADATKLWLEHEAELLLSYRERGEIIQPEPAQ